MIQYADMYVCKTLFRDASSVSNLLVSTDGFKLQLKPPEKHSPPQTQNDLGTSLHLRISCNLFLNRACKQIEIFSVMLPRCDCESWAVRCYNLIDHLFSGMIFLLGCNMLMMLHKT